MAKIFSGAARVGLARFVDPVARGLLRAGISPDVVTVLGTVGVLVGALGFGARGQFLIAVAIVVAFAPIDMIDGAMARARGYSTRFGALLDSTMDRIADGAIFGSVAFWYATTGQFVTMAVALVCVVAAQVISYVKARAQSLGFECEVGIAERGERLVLIGVGALLTGVGVAWALPAALWLLAVLSVITVGQRVGHVYRADRQSGRPESTGGER
ncbi:MAG TPA: CDP-alcohol phosphatidyltransferase family protein [Natronosporangium sp.]|nr:CDP-alcohol phosphatidyltransferase family protein [Natronosporangium sp.]